MTHQHGTTPSDGLISTVDQLAVMYGEVSDASTIKVSDRLTDGYRAIIEQSPLVMLATVGPEGLDCSPRGDDGNVVFVHDESTLMLPDRRGNNRIDSLRNIVRDPRVALLFLVPGSNTTLRVNGTAAITANPDTLANYAHGDKLPRTVAIITINEIYFQCARALMRADVWNADARVAPGTMPTPGELLKEMQASFDAETYDTEWPSRAAKTMW